MSKGSTRAGVLFGSHDLSLAGGISILGRTLLTRGHTPRTPVAVGADVAGYELKFEGAQSLLKVARIAEIERRPAARS